jgi:hypothetical protein
MGTSVHYGQSEPDPLGTLHVSAADRADWSESVTW